jgi:phosphomannomutase
VLLGEEVMDALSETLSIRFVNTNDDYSFHGLKPEPSAKNQKPLIDALRKSGRPLTLAAALDPDADRIRCADRDLDIDMNRFGAIAYANLLARGMRGGIASTVPSSDFALEIARQNGLEVIETQVGFKFFREPLSQQRALVAFEESDGISFIGHTLEKDAVAGLLAAIDSMATSGKPLSQQYEELRAKYGYFYPDKAGEDVKGVSVEAWQQYKDAVTKALTEGMFHEGESVQLGDAARRIAEVNTTDGLKLIFDDKSWILLRPSGTEPKFRYYYEVASPEPISDVTERLEHYRSTAASILARARAMADAVVGSAKA